jgi:signal recognition particle subunit SRP54
LVACDLQRPGAVKQLGVMAEQAGVAFFAPEPGDGVGDPVAVAKAGVAYATDKNHDVVIIDTAGRLGVDAEMMDQAAKIRKVTSPDEVLFVIDSMIGQDAVNTAEAFSEGVDFTGVVLTKLDGDAKGGAALSVTGVTGRPILFASTGEKLDDFEVFHPDRMASRILDLGDILSLIETAQKTFDEEQTKELEEKFLSETFTLDDFLGQLQQIKKMGSLGSMLGMLPGARGMQEQIDNIDEKDLGRTEAIIQSMTRAERINPKLLNGSRRMRIAKGSGMTVTDVNQLVTRFEQAAKMMKTVAKGGVPQIPGMGPIAGGGGKGKKKPKKKVAPRSGNPAKRAAEALGRPSGGTGQGSSFGLSAPPSED